MAYNRSMNKKRPILSIILTIIAIGCLFATGCLLISGILQMKHSSETAEALRPSQEQLVDSSQEISNEPGKIPSAELSSSEETIPSSSSEEAFINASEVLPTVSEAVPEPEPQFPNPYADAFRANKDMAAWLQIPGTDIDYPVMWTPGDENYYLYRDFDGSDNKNGCLILDTDSCLDPLTTNLIIHGHNMRSGAMFGNLTDYESKEYFENHRQMILYTEECQRNYEVIAVFRSQVYKKSDDVFKFYKFFQADTQEEFDDFYNNIKKLSLYDTGVTAQFGDHFLTLSTCVYHVKQGRFVVVARETEIGDSYLPISEETQTTK